ncbi:hypothetical protein CVS40_2815 [Lucilia cuprina]|nr:hypothetical protein CVS40_2815 [Lucilia cuprina]
MYRSESFVRVPSWEPSCRVLPRLIELLMTCILYVVRLWGEFNGWSYPPGCIRFQRVSWIDVDSGIFTANGFLNH